MSPDKAIDRISRFIRPGVRTGNHQDIQRLLPTFLRRSANVIGDSGVDAHCRVRGASVKPAGAILVDVEDFHGDGTGFERGREERGGEVGWGEHAEEVDGGEVEELDRVDEEDSDAGCGFRRHV